MAKSYTGKGDDGTSYRIVGGPRFSKASALPDALGTLDEANAAIGVARGALRRSPIAEELNTLNNADRYTLDGWLDALQHLLFRAGADLATPFDPSRASGQAAQDEPFNSPSGQVAQDKLLNPPQDQQPAAARMSAADLTALEASIDGLDAILPDLRAFILPQGNPVAAALHIARVVMRRAERALVNVREDGETLNEHLIPYINRLSSYLFALARWVNWRSGIQEEHPDYGGDAETK